MQYIETIILLPFKAIWFILDMLFRDSRSWAIMILLYSRYKNHIITDLKAYIKYCNTNRRHRK